VPQWPWYGGRELKTFEVIYKCPVCPYTETRVIQAANKTEAGSSPYGHCPRHDGEEMQPVSVREITGK